MGRSADYVTGSGENYITICYSTKHLGICRLDWVSEDAASLRKSIQSHVLILLL